MIRQAALCALARDRWRGDSADRRSDKEHAKKGAAFRRPKRKLRVDGSVEDRRSEHQRAGGIGQRAHDVERGASAVGLLQRPVTHVQLQAKQHAMVGDLGIP